MAFCKNSVISEFSFLGCKAQIGNPEIKENLYFLAYKAEMHLNLLYSFLSVRNDISKNELNLINLERSQSLKDKYLLHDQQCPLQKIP